MLHHFLCQKPYAIISIYLMEKTMDDNQGLQPEQRPQEPFSPIPNATNPTNPQSDTSMQPEPAQSIPQQEPSQPFEPQQNTAQPLPQQTIAQPTQPAQDAQRSQAQSSSKPKSKKLLIIIVAIILIGGIAAAAIIMLMPKGGNTTVGGETSDEKFDTSDICNNKPAFDKITKEVAVAYLKASHEDRNCSVKQLVSDEDFRLKDDKDHFKLLYSYEDTIEIEKIVKDGVMFLYEDDEDKGNIPLDIKQKDHYAIVKKQNAGKGDYNYVGVIFDKQFVSFGQVIEKEKDSTSYSEELNFKNTSKDWVEKAMGMIAASITYSASAYGYDLQENDNEYIYTVQYIGMGLDALSYDPANPTDMDYQLNTYTEKYTIDKKTGELERQRNSDDSGYYENIKHFKLTDEEIQELSKYIFSSM